MINLLHELNQCEFSSTKLIPNVYQENVDLGGLDCQNEDWPANRVRFRFEGDKSSPACPREWKVSINVKYQDGTHSEETDWFLIDDFSQSIDIDLQAAVKKDFIRKAKIDFRVFGRDPQGGNQIIFDSDELIGGIAMDMEQFLEFKSAQGIWPITWN